MLPIHSVAQMREMDARLAADVPMERVIERAGFGVAALAARILRRSYGAKVLVVVGRGNNGNDGRAAAKVLSSLGARVVIEAYDPSARLSSAEADLVIDAVFGFGFHGDFDGLGEVGRAEMLALDLPSGLDADSGTACLATARASFTLSLLGLKLGQLINDGPRLCGETYLYPLHGSPRVDSVGSLVLPEDISILPRDVSSHKWSSGLAVFGGSVGMSGAAIMASSAALRAGAGIVHLFAQDPSTALAVAARFPEVVVRTPSFDREGGHFSGDLDLSKFRALVIGPGLGKDAGEILRAVSGIFPGPLVIDADAVVAIGEDPRLLGNVANRASPSILTPHAGELARLMNGIKGKLDHAALGEFAVRNGLVLLVKGFPTRIYSPDGRFYVVPSNGPALATAGTGDVLSGVIGARIAVGGSDALTVAEGVMIHGLAAQVNPGPPLTSMELLERIPEAMRLLRSSKHFWSPGAFVPIGSRGPLYFAHQSNIEWRTT